MTDLPPPFDAAWFRFMLGFAVGGILGSFASMLVYRLPRGISIVAPRSHCPSCKAVLGARDLVPLLSWLCSRGRCRHCGKPIGARYLGIEIAVSLACAAAMTVWGFSPGLIAVYAVIVAAAVGFCIIFI